ncbi:MAG: creatininase family protein [Planctomycetota bacterium]|jgi:creatinine amidohydrolase
MYRRILVVVVMLAVLCAVMTAGAVGQEQVNTSTETLPVRYEQLTAVEFISAVEKSQRTCVIPLGVLEKHGPHLPLGTDLLDVREIALRAAEKEYTIVFPEYYFSQIFEGKHQPGTIAYSRKIIWNLLQETCDELSRNGIKKIIIVNGHGGNNHFLRFFCQAQLAERKDYAVYLFAPAEDPEVAEKVKKLRKTKTDGHAGEIETSIMMVNKPELVQLEKAKSQSGQDQERLKGLDGAYVGIWWYASFPNHYAGDGSAGSVELGKLLVDSNVEQLAEMLGKVKKDKMVLELQNRFFDEAESPLETKQ